MISKEVFDQLNEQFVEVRRYYGGENARIRAVASKLRSTAASESLRTRVADLMETSLVTCSADATVQEAAQIMTERNVS
ncbi:CBS domain-containing protein, partial [Lactobacillus paragasseri]